MSELEIEIPVNVRFSDTDAMGVVWHGNYLRFFEDAREAFGAKYEMAYLDVYKNGFFTPIVKSGVEHKSPIYFGEQVVVKARLIPAAAAKIIFEFTITNLTTGLISATGTTIQVFLNASNRTLELSKPDFYRDWEKKTGIII